MAPPQAGGGVVHARAVGRGVGEGFTSFAAGATGRGPDTDADTVASAASASADEVAETAVSREGSLEAPISAAVRFGSGISSTWISGSLAQPTNETTQMTSRLRSMMWPGVGSDRRSPFLGGRVGRGGVVVTRAGRFAAAYPRDA